MTDRDPSYRPRPTPGGRPTHPYEYPQSERAAAVDYPQAQDPAREYPQAQDPARGYPQAQDPAYGYPQARDRAYGYPQAELTSGHMSQETTFTPESKKPRKILIIAAVLVVLVAATAGVGYKLVSSGDDKPNTFTGNGSIVLADDGDDENPNYETDGGTCSGAGGYSDLSSGVEVRVTGSDGNSVATGALDPGTEASDGCEFDFVIKDIPTGQSTYGVTISTRGTLRYTQVELTDGIELSLGGN